MERKKRRKVIMEAEPKSFKIYSKSSTKSRLKSAISAELHRFLGNRYDDILAEYITVLVCNGKHQYQARDDLEAFLGARSGEFVSWLWELLSRYAHEANEWTSELDSNDAIAVEDCDVDEDRDSRFDRSMSGDKMLVKDEKTCHLLFSAGHPVSCNDVESTEGFQHVHGFLAPLLPGMDNRLLPNKSETLEKDSTASEVFNNSLAFDSSVKRGPAVLPASQKQNVPQLEIIKKIVLSNKNVMPKKEVFSRDVQSSISEYHTSRKTCSPKVSGGHQSQTAVGSVFQRIEKPQGSVWDRLDKPCEDIPACSNATILHDDGFWKQEVLAPHTPNFPLWTCEVGWRTPKPFPRLGNIFYGSKRPFNEISNRPSRGFVSSAGEKNVNIQCKETSQDLKKPNLIAKNPKTAPHLASEVTEVKQRLFQVETEILKIRAKQMEKENYGKARLFSNPGLPKDSAGYIESRTVVVSNVHIAATRQALYSYFRKCGMIAKLFISKKKTCHPNGSAYVTFASPESVNKAIALNGSTFFSRTLKVQRKAEDIPRTSVPTHLAGKLSSAMSKASTVPSRAEQQGVESSMQQLPASVASEKNQVESSSPISAASTVPSSAERKGVE